ncbi:sensor histidine kinase [Phyllobacterium meliloti]|uniref:sensor histidine kinase n=1 Tax=Phyllobacterium meliloti TaxID=555317 RepID=UPI001D148495|nr:CHASE3 domain-containing protein [Phyllobacterium sp. T1293]UGX85966.1 CHASE3 domain-containing protein [Phyllobacterium sp. T1293]
MNGPVGAMHVMQWRRLLTGFSERPGRGLAILISLVLIVTAAVSTIILTRGFNNQMDDVIATYRVREQADSTLALLNAAHSNQRGFLLTQNPAFLDLYRTSSSHLDESLNTLNEMTRGNSRQQVIVSQIQGLAKQKQQKVDSAIALSLAGNNSDALASLGPDFGIGQMDEIKKTINGFLAEEDRRLIARNIAMDDLRFWLTIASIAALGGALILAYILASRTKRYVRKLTEGQSTLLSEKSQLEEMVQLRTAELEKAMMVATRERARVETLLQDSDHRIGNSLATVSSLLGIQMRDVSSEEIRAALGAARDRIQTISSAHRRLRLGKDHETVRADEYLPEVIADLKDSHVHDRDIQISAHIEPIDLSSRDATTLGIIIGELTMNAIKHAFPHNRTGSIAISLAHDVNGVVALDIADDGVGIQKKLQKRASGIGSVIVAQLCQQFGGEVNYAANPSGGTLVTVTFPSLQSARTPEEKKAENE